MELLLVYAAVFIGGLLIFERLTGFVTRRLQRSSSLNRRLKLLESTESSLDVYKTMVKERGLAYNPAGLSSLVMARRLFAQSGLKLEWTRILIYVPMGTAVAWFFMGWLGMPVPTRLIV